MAHSSRRSARSALTALAILVAAPALVASAQSPGPSTVAGQTFRAHQYFDDTTGPPPPGQRRGAAAQPLMHPKVIFGGATSRSPAAASPSSIAATPPAPPDPEVLGFVQSGEVSSGAWAADLRFNLLSTVAYFGVNVNADGTLISNDSGYTTWWSSQTTNLINAAHRASDRVVLTIKAFNDNAIAGATGSEQARQTLINATVNEVLSRPADGVNVDFEGVSSGLAANFTTFVAELRSALVGRAAGHSYLTVDTYAAAGQGGSMYDLAQLWHHVDALDLMGYGFEPCTSGRAGPSAPMGGCWYNVTQAVGDYMNRFGVPASELLLGVPYYGYKWNVSGLSGAGEDPTTSGGSADTYAAALSDFACAQQLQQHWDSTYQGPWATWFSPASGDPCGGNHNSYRELYYDNAQSLGAKYDLVNNRSLRGIGIWALGYDSGTSDLWNEIAAKFTVSNWAPRLPSFGAPSASVFPDGSQQLLFWRGPNDHLAESWYSGGAWHGPADLTSTVLGPAATMGSTPAVSVTPDGSTQIVFWKGAGSHLYEAWYAAGGWHGPIDVISSLNGAALLGSAPTAAVDRDGTQLVFWQGAGGHLFEAWWAAARWNGPVDWTAQAFSGSGTLASAPSVAVTPDGSQLVFWQGAGGHLFEAWWAAARWNGPVDWTASAFANRATLTSSPSATVVADGSQQLVFWQGAGGHLLEAWWAGARWNGPVDWTTGAFAGAGLLGSAPSATASPDGAQLVFWQGAAQSIWEGWYTGRWNGPANLSAGWGSG